MTSDRERKKEQKDEREVKQRGRLKNFSLSRLHAANTFTFV